MKNLNSVLIGIILITNIIGCNSSNKSANKSYANVDEALSKYDFEAARELCAKAILDWADDSRQCQSKIIQSEVTYYSDNKLFDKAIASLNEYKFSNVYQQEVAHSYNHNKDQNNYNTDANWYNSVLEIITTKLFLTGDDKKAIAYLQMYAKGIAIFNYEKNSINYFKLDYSWRDEKVKALKQIK